MAFKMSITTKRTVDGVTEEKKVKVQHKDPLSDALISELICKVLDIDETVQRQAAPKPPVSEKASEAPKPAKMTTLIGAKETGFTIGDRLEKKPVKGEYVRVLIDKCELCGYVGEHDTIFGNLYTKCRGCGEKLHLRNACDEAGVKDEDGFIYIAYAKYLTRKERWELEQKELAEIAEREKREPVHAT
jgi:hypothetical protein